MVFKRIRTPGGDSWEQRALGCLPVQLMLELQGIQSSCEPLLWGLGNQEKRTDIRRPETGHAVPSFPSA